MGYAQRQKLLLCLDSGHFHPTETISDKITRMMTMCMTFFRIITPVFFIVPLFQTQLLT